MQINDRLEIPESEFQWSFVRSGGPGGQNVNKVASKAVLRWDLAGSPSLPVDIKAKLQTLERRRITKDGELVLSSQRYRDQDRNRQDCLEKLREMVLRAATPVRKRKPTRATRGSHEARLASKRRRSTAKSRRRLPAED